MAGSALVNSRAYDYDRRLTSVLQEAPLTLRGQRGYCKNIKGNPKYLETSLAQGHTHFSSGCGFMVGLGKSQQHAKFEVHSS